MSNKIEYRELDEMKEILDINEYLMYRSYAYNRTISPHVNPDRWRSLYLNQEKYEEKYQEEMDQWI